jgi:hypothetical protein
MTNQSQFENECPECGHTNKMSSTNCLHECENCHEVFSAPPLEFDGYDICVACGTETDNGTLHHRSGCLKA